MPENNNPTTNTTVHELLQSLFEHSFAHPADWSDWRQTLLLFAQAEGIDRDVIENAHENARNTTGNPDHVDEITHSREVAEEYIEQLPLEDDPRTQNTDQTE